MTRAMVGARLRGVLPLLAAAGTGAGAALGQAPWGLWPLTVAGLAGLAWLVAAAPGPRAAFARGWWGAAAMFALAMSWIVEPFLIEPERHGWMAPFALLILPGGLALFWGAAAALAARLAAPGAGRAWAFALTATGAEALRGWLFGGFPWAMPGHVWIDTPLAQLGALTGPLGLTGLTLALAAGFAGMALGPGAAGAAPELPPETPPSPGAGPAPGPADAATSEAERELFSEARQTSGEADALAPGRLHWLGRIGTHILHRFGEGHRLRHAKQKPQEGPGSLRPRPAPGPPSAGALRPPGRALAYPGRGWLGPGPLWRDAGGETRRVSFFRPTVAGAGLASEGGRAVLEAGAAPLRTTSGAADAAAPPPPRRAGAALRAAPARPPAPAALLLAAIPLGLAAVGWAWGVGQLARAMPEATPTRIRLVQPNADQALKWDPAHAELHFLRHLDLTAAPAEDGRRPDLVLWAETAVPFALETPGAGLAMAAEAAGGAELILGIQRSAPDGAGVRRYYNSLAVLDAQGAPVAVYDKHHLVPFGEYVPYLSDYADRPGWEWLAGFAAQALLGYTPGPGPAVLDLGPLGRALPLICYEAIFPRHLRGTQRPDWLLQLTNDAWFGAVSGPYQHLAQTRLRAIEQGLPLVRVANTGVSAVIDARGRVLASLPLNTAGFLDADLPAPLAPTLYARTGDWPWHLGLILALAGLGLAGRRGWR